MALEQLGLVLGNELAASDLSGAQYQACRITALGVALAGAGEDVDGVLQNKPLSGEACALCVNGKSKIKVAGALAKGTLVAVDATGKAVAAASGDYILGKLLEASSGADEVVSVLLTRPGRLA